MIGLLMVLAAAQYEAADWGCAAPLIEKNYARRIASAPLAKRISDECIRHPSSTDPYARQVEELSFIQEGTTFYLQIRERIEARRRRDAIKLIR